MLGAVSKEAIGHSCHLPVILMEARLKGGSNKDWREQSWKQEVKRDGL